MTLLYSDPVAAVILAERRLRLLMFGLNLLNVAFALFGVTTFLGLAGAFAHAAAGGVSGYAVAAIVLGNAVALSALLGASVAFVMESSCARGMMRLHPPVVVTERPRQTTEPRSG